MGTKWSTTAVTGYASASVTDDGAATAANQVKYNTIKTDLTNPIKSTLTQVITNLDELFTIATKAKSGSYTTVASDHTVCIEVTGTNTITLLAAATGGAGYQVTVKNAGSGLVTVARSGADTIDGATSVRLGPNESKRFIANAALDGYWDGNFQRILQIVHATDAGSSTSATSYTNMNNSSVAIVPKSATSKLLIELSFHGAEGIVVATNTKATFQLYESPSTGIGFEPELQAAHASDGISIQSLCMIRHRIDSSGITSRSFGLQGKTNNGGAAVSATKMVFTITEYIA